MKRTTFVAFASLLVLSCLFGASLLRSHPAQSAPPGSTPAAVGSSAAVTSPDVVAPAVAAPAAPIATASAAHAVPPAVKKKNGATVAVSREPVHRGPAAARMAARSGDGDGDADRGAETKRVLSQAEIAALWKYSAGSAVTPVMSRPLRDTPARASIKDPSVEAEDHDLPIRGRGRAPDFSAGIDKSLQQVPGPSLLTATGVNFDGLVANGSAPPDSDGHVGPNHYVQWINSQFAIYDKSGTLLYGPAQGNSLFTALGPTSVCATTNEGDPIVVYDPMADRWVLTQFAVEAPPTGQASYQCTAVSVTGDPLGAYYIYEFPLAPDKFFDYPHVGTWLDSYYTTYHVFNGLGTAFVGQGLVAYERPAMIAGLPARFVYTDMSDVYFGALPADIDGLTPPPAGEAETILAPGSSEWDGTTAAGTSVLHVWQATTTWGATPATTLTGPNDVATSLFNTNMCNFARNCVPEPGITAANRLDAISGRLMNRVAYVNRGGLESFVVSHTVNNGANVAAVRWYELRNPGATPTIFQQGTYNPDANFRWVPSVAMDNSGNIAVGFSKSSATVNPEIDVVGRLSTDAPGTLGTESVLQAGLGTQTGTANRWGDYTSMTVDPRDGCTFWYTNQYQPPGVGTFNWKSRIGAFRFAPSECTAPAKGTVTGTVRDSGGAPIAGALVQLDNGFSGATSAAGVYSIVTTPGTYNIAVSAPLRNGCISPPGSVVTINNGGVTTRNFVLSGTAGFALDNESIDDSIGNNNGVINRNECVIINLEVGNIGCGVATDVSGVLSTSTPGVTVTQNTSAYANLAAGSSGLNLTPFQIATSPTFACGTPIDFTLTVSSASGGGPFFFSLPTCAAPPVVQADAITPTDLDETSRLGRNGIPSTCAGKACPGPNGTGTRKYDAYNFSNDGVAARCITVTLAANCGLSSDGNVFSGAYLGTFDPSNVCTNYVGDLGGSPFNGTSASYTFTVPGSTPFVVVVNESTAGTGCASYTLTVDGLIDNGDGGRPAAPVAGNDGPACEGGSVTLTASTIPNATYSWTGPNGFTSTLQNPVLTNVVLGEAGTYTVIASVGGCFTDPATTVVVVNPVPAAPSAGSNSPVAAGQTINLTASTILNATYSWTGPNGFTSTQQNPTIPNATSANAGVYSVTATVGGCTSLAGTTTVVIADLVPVTLAVDTAHNGVFEQGETAIVSPGWMNQGATTDSPTGIFSNFTGPAGPAYTITDSTADYGPISAGATTNCATATGNCYSLNIGSGARPVAHWDTTVDETLSDGSTKTWTLHVGGSFTDVPVGNPFYKSVETVFHNGVTAGCGPDTYCPTTTVTRAQMSVLLLKAKEGAGYTPPACVSPVFADVPCSSGFAPFINELAARGVTAGCGGGNFCPNLDVTRAQMSVFLLRTLEGSLYNPPACVTATFADVPCSSSFAPWVDEIAARGITTGCGGGNFCPNASTPRNQMAVFLTTTFSLVLYGP